MYGPSTVWQRTVIFHAERSVEAGDSRRTLWMNGVSGRENEAPEEKG